MQEYVGRFADSRFLQIATLVEELSSDSAAHTTSLSRYIHTETCIMGPDIELKPAKQESSFILETSPVPDPMKKSPVSRSRPQQISSTRSYNKLRKMKSPLPPIPIILDSDPPSDSVGTCVTTCGTPAGRRFNDKDVFRGLHVATAAACDEDVDKYIEEIVGCGVRRFLADLSAFDGLGVNSLAAVARRAAKQRRNQVRAWEKIRGKRSEETSESPDLEGRKTFESIDAR